MIQESITIIVSNLLEEIHANSTKLFNSHNQ